MTARYQIVKPGRPPKHKADRTGKVAINISLRDGVRNISRTITVCDAKVSEVALIIERVLLGEST